MCGNQKDGFQIGEGFISVMIADIISEHEIFSVIVLLKFRHSQKIENVGFIFGKIYGIITSNRRRWYVAEMLTLLFYDIIYTKVRSW